MNITVLHTIDDQIIKKWQRLWNDAPSAHFFNSPQWFLSCVKQFTDQKYVILIVEKEDGFEAILPLFYEKKFGVSLWTDPGERFVDKSSLLVRKLDEEVMEILLQKLTNMGNFELQELEEKIADMLTNINQNIYKQHSSLNYYLPLDEDPLRFMSNKMRNQTRNKIKRNEEHLTYKSYKGDPGGLEIAFELDKRSSKRKQGKSTFVRKSERDFFRHLVKVNGQSVRVDVLFYDGKPVIYGIGFTSKNTYQACITAYDDTYSFLSPGKMLHFYMFQSLKEDGMTHFDFSRGVTVLKKEFTHLFNPQYNLFYGQTVFTRIWWRFMYSLYTTVLGNKTLYGLYLLLKKIVYH